MQVSSFSNPTHNALSRKPSFQGKRHVQRAQIEYLKEKNGWNENKPKLHQRAWHHRWKIGLVGLSKNSLTSKERSKKELIFFGVTYLLLVINDVNAQSYDLDDPKQKTT